MLGVRYYLCDVLLDWLKPLGWLAARNPPLKCYRTVLLQFAVVAVDIETTLDLVSTKNLRAE